MVAPTKELQDENTHPPEQFDANLAAFQLPFKTHWRQYTIDIGESGRRHLCRLSIVDPDGHAVKEILAARFHRVSDVQFGPKGRTALWIDAAPFVNSQHSARTYLFTADPKLRNVLVVPGCIDQVRLVGSRREVLIVGNTATMEWIGDLCHACAPDIELLFGLKSGRFVLRNKRYPSVPRAEARAYERALKSSFSRDYHIGEALGYYANLETIGRGRQALAYLHRRLTPWYWERLTELVPEANKRLHDTSSLFWTDNRTEYVVTEN